MPFNLGAGELLVVLLVALLVLGPDKLPQAARNVGKVLAEVRRVTSGFQAELRDALQEPVSGTPPQAAKLKAPPSPPRTTAGGGDPPTADAADTAPDGGGNGRAPSPDGDGGTGGAHVTGP